VRKVIVSTYVTLDGVMEDPGGTGEFEHRGWTMPFFDEEAGKYARDQLLASDALLLGGRPTKCSRLRGRPRHGSRVTGTLPRG
jgi:hypothetical protein